MLAIGCQRAIQLSIFSVLFGMLLGCEADQTLSYQAKPYLLEYGNLPTPAIPPDNPLTEEGVELGRHLFYDERLSVNETQSCGSCHLQAYGFSDTARFSRGAEGMTGHRQAMASFNMLWHRNQFFWDGRANLLRDQVLLPIQDPLEMNVSLEEVLARLQADQMYTDMFEKTFGSPGITEQRLALALEQFIHSIVSYSSKYDLYLRGEAVLTETEERGRQLFFAEYNPNFPDLSGADCQHCHSGSNFENDRYMNNGLDSDAGFTDLGREMVTGNPADRAKFKVPTLRNVAVTFPYMHDGRFATLVEVIDHYDHGLQTSSTLAPELAYTMTTGLLLTDQDKADIIAFLHTLTDTAFLQNPIWSNPFE